MQRFAVISAALLLGACLDGEPVDPAGYDAGGLGDASVPDSSDQPDAAEPDAAQPDAEELPPADGDIVAAEEFVPDAATLADLAASSPLAHARLQRLLIQRITYLSDGLQVRGWLIEPRAAGVYPGVIYNRGGNREYGAISESLVIYWISRFADFGYVVAASQYRGNAGGEGIEEFGGAEVNDVLNLVPLLDDHPKADASRLGMYGHSRGGMMTYLALRQTEAFSAGIVDAGVSDCFAWILQRPEMEDVFADLVPDYWANRDAALVARSAIRWPADLPAATPLLLIHGTADTRVEPSHASLMDEALRAVGRPVQLELFPGADHALSGFLDEESALIEDWLNSYVRDQQAWNP